MSREGVEGLKKSASEDVLGDAEDNVVNKLEFIFVP